MPAALTLLMWLFWLRPDPSVEQFPKQQATNVNPDTHLTLTFSQPPVVGRAGEIRVYDRADGSLVDILDLAIPPGPPPRSGRAGTPREVFTATYQKAVIGDFREGFHFYPIIVHDRTVTITLHPHVLKHGRTYDVTMDSGVLNVEGFSGFQRPNVWTFRTRKAAPPANATRLVVAANGSGDFSTVQGAVDFVPSTPHPRVTIFIRRGTYEEIVYFRNKHDVTFLGEDRAGVVIGYANNEVFNGPPAGIGTNETRGTFPYRRASFMADRSTRIHVVNLTLRNFTPEGGSQAEALLLSGGQNIVSHVNAYGFQDTAQFNDSVFISESLIEGETDFLWGRGPAYFDRAELREISNSPYMWVRSTAASHGFVFVNSQFATKLTAGAGPFLARNTVQYPDSEIVLIDSKLGRINPAAWSLPEGYGQAHYWESGSRDIDTNQPVDVSHRHPSSKQLDPDRDAATIVQYRDPAFVLGGWKPQMQPIFLESPKRTSALPGHTLKLSVIVAAVPTPTYEWRRDGKVIHDAGHVTGAGTPELSISEFSRADAGHYSVVAVNSSGRVESPVAVVGVLSR